MNVGPRSDTVSVGRPWSQNTCFRTNLPVSLADGKLEKVDEVGHFAEPTIKGLVLVASKICIDVPSDILLHE